MIIMNRMRRLPRVFLLVAVLFSGAWGQEWPAKPVRIVVPFPPGGAADALPRIFSDKLSQRFGQPFVVENRAGATGSIGAEIVSRAEPDGSTFLGTPPSPLILNPYLYVRLPYDPWQFVPVGIMAQIPSVLLVHPKVPANSVAELVAYAKSNPGKLNYASQGTASLSFLTTEMFLNAAGGLKIQHVPYKGTAPGITALLAGEVEMMIDNLGATVPHVRSGRLKALGVFSDKRHPAIPEVPAMVETMPGMLSNVWFGIVAPPRTPAAIAEKFSAAIRDELKSPDVQKRIAALSAEPVGSTPAEMARIMKEDAERWRGVIRDAGVKPGEL
jgi:tripartite-type tricarboxylate transporter receptor subunit TctC